MKRLETEAVRADLQPAGKPLELPLELLEHVAGGLPYGGGWAVTPPAASSATSTEGDLPYGGGWL
jgi:hypothetical protein